MNVTEALSVWAQMTHQRVRQLEPAEPQGGPYSKAFYDLFLALQKEYEALKPDAEPVSKERQILDLQDRLDRSETLVALTRQRLAVSEADVKRLGGVNNAQADLLAIWREQQQASVLKIEELKKAAALVLDSFRALDTVHFFVDEHYEKAIEKIRQAVVALKEATK